MAENFPRTATVGVAASAFSTAIKAEERQFSHISSMHNMKSIVPWVLLLLLVVCDAACLGPREDQMPTATEDPKTKRSLMDSVHNFMSSSKAVFDSPFFFFTPLGYIFDSDLRDNVKQKAFKY